MKQMPRAVGINHVALEVFSLEEELQFLGKLFDFKLRSKSDEMAFIELGDQFIALFASDARHTDQHRHFGLVVDDKNALHEQLKHNGVENVSDRFLEFRDPSGNLWQVVEYAEIEYLKNPSALKSIGVKKLGKTADARADLERKGISPVD